MTSTQKKEAGNSLKAILLSYFTEFCDLTSLHGFAFMSWKKFRPLDRTYWAIVISVVYIALGALIVQFAEIGRAHV